MKTAFKFFLIVALTAAIIGAASGEAVIPAIASVLPILPPLGYLTHVLLYSYDVQADYVDLWIKQNNCIPSVRPLWVALAAVLSGALLALLTKSTDTFTLGVIVLIALAGYLLDARKQFEATTALVCKIMGEPREHGR